MTVDRDIFVDTRAFIAIRVRDDANHKKAFGFLDTIKERHEAAYNKLHTG